MTVQPISDEELAELEGYSQHDPFAAITMGELRGLIARLRAAEADAKRYRWLRDKSADADGVYPMVSLTDDCGDQVSNWLFGKAVDKAVDEAMESTP
ncbi:hypothetical protein EWS90_01980 [Pseudomonas aeruginosa]|uniref:hypothetical protein n=1 Tax=Pseudomonas aeruginosa TaxID=287 RepID=UPI00101B0472|nr:hypothetical protein [Pseudomonas aeruginosa]MDI4187099.1 hypothetical protein [Pseudomonas aeruginosa]QBC05421.1 hypothetical protein EWS90_01980 [Pseudomonas aeruginosa]HDQ4498086.1 hypothetical protein [Pseudomonas aeruginosa]